MKLALVQPHPPAPCPDQTLAAIESWVTGLAALGADLVVLPELILPGYNRPERHRSAAQPLGGAWCTAMAALARTAGTALCYGWAERAGGQIFNAASVIDKKGTQIAHYRKIQLFGAVERASFAFGTEAPAVFDLGGTRMGLLICYDIEFPEHARGLARAGAEVILVPTANPAGYDHVPEILVRARASENALSIAYANYTGTDHGLRFGGRSLIAGPDGQALAQAGSAPAVLLVDLPQRQDCRPETISAQLTDLRQPFGAEETAR
ncbi:carbon-nitrogen hydrolase family protein [Rhodobacter lacus]|uniref:Carbon-nitrogen hydrolase family protein n=1 Tax=Rhodobacter lacus TaxID=1641972 RepID=A0ABW5A6T0_9RHOB